MKNTHWELIERVLDGSRPDTVLYVVDASQETTLTVGRDADICFAAPNVDDSVSRRQFQVVARKRRLSVRNIGSGVPTLGDSKKELAPGADLTLSKTAVLRFERVELEIRPAKAAGSGMCLEIRAPRRSTRRIPLTDHPLRVGREAGTEVDVAVPVDGVSSRHFSISYDAKSGKVHLTDLGSRNGVHLLDRKTNKAVQIAGSAALEVGNLFSFGKATGRVVKHSPVGRWARLVAVPFVALLLVVFFWPPPKDDEFQKYVHLVAATTTTDTTLRNFSRACKDRQVSNLANDTAVFLLKVKGLEASPLADGHSPLRENRLSPDAYTRALEILAEKEREIESSIGELVKLRDSLNQSFDKLRKEHPKVEMPEAEEEQFPALLAARLDSLAEREKILLSGIEQLDAGASALQQWQDSDYADNGTLAAILENCWKDTILPLTGFAGTIPDFQAELKEIATFRKAFYHLLESPRSVVRANCQMPVVSVAGQGGRSLRDWYDNRRHLADELGRIAAPESWESLDMSTALRTLDRIAGIAAKPGSDIPAATELSRQAAAARKGIFDGHAATMHQWLERVGQMPNKAENFGDAKRILAVLKDGCQAFGSTSDEVEEWKENRNEMDRRLSSLADVMWDFLVTEYGRKDKGKDAYPHRPEFEYLLKNCQKGVPPKLGNEATRILGILGWNDAPGE